MSEDKRTPSGGYRQDWPAYHAAQTNEKPHFLFLLRELCQDIEEPEHLTGCTPFPLRDMAFSIIYKVYSTFSSRRFEYNLLEAKSMGLISEAPSSNCISDYMRKGLMTPILQQRIIKSSLPLAQVERVFAVDSTGLGIPKRRPWFNKHKRRWEKRRDYVKLHTMCGVLTNIITYAEVSGGTAYDGNYFKRLVEGTARYFEISEVSADTAYTSPDNRRVVVLVGGVPYIAFKKNCVPHGEYKSTHWKDTLHLYQSRNKEFMRRYYLRNNIEATFSAMKAKHGDRLRSKSQRGQINEALCKVLCHNLCVLIQSMYEFGIDPASWSEARLSPLAESGSIGRALTDREFSLVRNRIVAGSGETPVPQESFKNAPEPQAEKKKYCDPDQISLFD